MIIKHKYIQKKLSMYWYKNNKNSQIKYINSTVLLYGILKNIHRYLLRILDS